MVFCTKCGKENEENAGFCTNCGAALQPRRDLRSDDECFGPRRDRGRECFGLPSGGMIFGVLFGIMIVVVGLAILWGQDIERWIGPLFMIMLGLLMVSGALYALTRRRS